MNLWLGRDYNESMSQAEKALGWWRTGLNDLWNIHGIVASVGYGIDGQPYATSHYGFHMVLVSSGSGCFILVLILILILLLVSYSLCHI